MLRSKYPFWTADVDVLFADLVAVLEIEEAQDLVDVLIDGVVGAIVAVCCYDHVDVAG